MMISMNKPMLSLCETAAIMHIEYLKNIKGKTCPEGWLIHEFLIATTILLKLEEAWKYHRRYRIVVTLRDLLQLVYYLECLDRGLFCNASSDIDIAIKNLREIIDIIRRKEL